MFPKQRSLTSTTTHSHSFIQVVSWFSLYICSVLMLLGLWCPVQMFPSKGLLALLHLQWGTLPTKFIDFMSLSFGLSLHIVGNLPCLVLLCLICMRCDKVCPLYCVWNWGYTNLNHPPQKLYGQLENHCTMSAIFFSSQNYEFQRV